MGQLLGGLFGIGNGANQASQQAANAASQASQNAQQLDQWLMNLVGGDQSMFSSMFAPVMGAQGQGLLSMLQNPTQLTGLNSIANPVTQFYQNEMTQGLDPRFVGNLYSQNQQGASQQLSDMINQLGPGFNTGAATRNMQNSLLSANTNLAGQLAGMNQQVEQQGAQGMLGVGQAMNEQTVQQQQLRDQVMQLLQQFTNAGLGMKQAGYGAIGGAAGQQQQASQFDYGMSAQDAQMANQQQQDFFNSLVSLGGSFMPGGMFAGLFGGGGGGLNLAGALPGAPGSVPLPSDYTWLPGGGG